MDVTCSLWPLEEGCKGRGSRSASEDREVRPCDCEEPREGLDRTPPEPLVEAALRFLLWKKLGWIIFLLVQSRLKTPVKSVFVQS